MSAHVLEYRAGHELRIGLDNGVPHWRCSCGAWRIDRNLRTGSPQRATAERHHRKHVAQAVGAQ